MKKWTIPVGILMLAGSSFSVSAQKIANEQPRIFSFPDFLHVDPLPDDDTTWSFEYFDKDVHRIRIADLTDVSEIDQIKLYKMFKAPTGGAFAPDMFSLAYRFVQLDTNMWVRFDHDANKRQRYQMLSGQVVRIDTIKVLDPVTRKQRKVVYKYLKTKAVGPESN